MVELAFALALMAVAGVVVLTFGYARLLAEVRTLQRSRGERTAASTPQLATGQQRFVLVVTPSCFGCVDRLKDLTALAATHDPGRFTVLSPVPIHLDDPDDRIDVVIDANIYAAIDVSVTPSVLVLDGSGSEMRRRVVGSEQALTEEVQAFRKTSSGNVSTSTGNGKIGASHVE